MQYLWCIISWHPLSQLRFPTGKAEGGGQEAVTKCEVTLKGFCWRPRCHVFTVFSTFKQGEQRLQELNCDQGTTFVSGDPINIVGLCYIFKQGEQRLQELNYNQGISFVSGDPINSAEISKATVGASCHLSH